METLECYEALEKSKEVFSCHTQPRRRRSARRCQWAERPREDTARLLDELQHSFRKATAFETVLFSLQYWHQARPHLPDLFPMHLTFYYTLESVLREGMSSASQ